jgi:hypothetical protein
LALSPLSVEDALVLGKLGPTTTKFAFQAAVALGLRTDGEGVLLDLDGFRLTVSALLVGRERDIFSSEELPTTLSTKKSAFVGSESPLETCRVSSFDGSADSGTFPTTNAGAHAFPSLVFRRDFPASIDPFGFSQASLLQPPASFAEKDGGGL